VATIFCLVFSLVAEKLVKKTKSCGLEMLVVNWCDSREQMKGELFNLAENYFLKNDLQTFS